MTPTAVTRPTTALESLVLRLRHLGKSPEGEAAPTAILWTDPDSQWLPLLAQLRQELPELLTLGEYSPDLRRGPAIWLRCAMERVLEDVELPEGQPVILYLPGISRQALRAGPDCPPELRPLVELLYRGKPWYQVDGQDWTVSALLSSKAALNLDLAKDKATREALARALPEVATTPLSVLRGKRLDAAFFDGLLTGDIVRDLLLWMNDPGSSEGRMGASRWLAFQSQCMAKWSFQPGADDPITAGERLGNGDPGWDEVWERYSEAPGSYPGIFELLLRAQPRDMYAEASRWPAKNEAAEKNLVTELEKVRDVPHAALCGRIEELDAEHGERRKWLWTGLGKAPFAKALDPLARLARSAKSPLGGLEPNEIATAYTAGAWEADAAALDALVLAHDTGNPQLVQHIVRQLLLPWQDQSAKALQTAVQSHPLPTANGAAAIAAEPGQCLMFSDGLRFDVAKRLQDRLESMGCEVQLEHGWAASPSVTATGKPAVSPAAGELSGDELGEDFAARVTGTGRAADAKALRKTIETLGYQIIGDSLGDMPLRDDARGWIEFGDIDSLGHKTQIRLARQLSDEVDVLAKRIVALLESGWRQVRIVTDHGWLLVPGGLPKVELPKHLTESRWARCAVVAGNSTVSVPTYPWYWNPSEAFATAPGIGCFNQSVEYAHGGISIQECVIPDMRVELLGGTGPRAQITAATWKGMRCYVEVSGTGGPLRVDLRLGTPGGESIAGNVRAVDDEGLASVLLTDDAHEDSDLVLVVLDSNGTVLAQHRTRVGSNS